MSSIVAQTLANVVATNIVITPAFHPCPECGKHKVLQIRFGSIVLGSTCRACKWERPG